MEQNGQTGQTDPDPAVALPTPVRLAAALVWAVIALSGLTALLTVVLRDQLVDSWAVGKPADLEPPAFVPVAITMFVVLALLGWVLVVFFRIGHGWARWAIAALVVFSAFVSLIGLGRDLPTAFVLLTVVSLVLDAVALVLLFHRDTTAYLRPRHGS
jgi:hypothetical protein